MWGAVPKEICSRILKFAIVLFDYDVYHCRIAFKEDEESKPLSIERFKMMSKRCKSPCLYARYSWRTTHRYSVKSNYPMQQFLINIAATCKRFKVFVKSIIVLSKSVHGAEYTFLNSTFSGLCE